MKIKEKAMKAISHLKNKLFGNTSLKKHEAKKSPKRFSCSDCDKTFDRGLELKIHTRKHEKPYSCGLCHYKCSTKQHLKQHECNKHTDEKPYSCSLCDYKFKTKGQLQTHRQNRHTGEKSVFNCSKCNKDFTGRNTKACCLKDHKNIYTGVKPFSCSKSDKCYSRNDTLNIHEKTHTCGKDLSLLTKITSGLKYMR